MGCQTMKHTWPKGLYLQVEEDMPFRVGIIQEFSLYCSNHNQKEQQKSLLIPITPFLSSLSYSFSTPFTTTSTNSSVGKQTLNTQVFPLSVIYVKHQFIWRRYYFQLTISWI
jgi:hypothetical protein